MATLITTTVNGDINFTSTLKFGGVNVIHNGSTDVYGNIRVLYSASTLADGMYINYNSAGGGGAHLRFFANSTNERMRIDASNGNVGIGTTNPLSKLDVSLASGQALFIANESGTISDGDLLGAVSFGSRDGSTYSSGGVTNIRSYATSTYNTGNVSGDMRFYVSSSLQNTTQAALFGTEAMRITDGGNVGIGTTAPGYKLDVSGTAYVSDDLLVGATNASSWHRVSIATGGFIAQSGGRGIGAYVDATAAEFFAYNYNTPAYIPLLISSSTLNIANNAGSSIIYHDGTNVGIGTTSPSDRLHVRFSDTQGYIRIGGSNGAGNSRVFIAAEGDSSYMDSYGNNTHKPFSINANPLIFGIGNVLINTTTNSSYRLDVNGTIRASGDIIAYSDARVKENINTIEGALDKVLHLRGVSYNKIGETDKKIGVIAQEVLGILPEVVSEDLQGMYSVAYGNIVGVLIEAIKELTVKVEQLEAKLK